MSEDIRKNMNAVSRLNQPELADGFANRGATPVSGPPNYVRTNADLGLCKEALSILSRNLRAEIATLIEDEPRFAAVFDLETK